MQIKIVSRWNLSRVLWEGVADSLGDAVVRAVAAGASLDGASLVGASLDGASLVGASLRRASLVDASLDGASLVGASLDGASLVGASLDGASLVGASLDGASLDGASLVDASLVGASLDGASLDDASLVGASLRRASLVDASLVDASLVDASLDGASLRRASLDGASLPDEATKEALKARGATFDGDGPKEDLWRVLDAAPDEVPALLAALREGRVNGRVYGGECACLVGTIANARGCRYTELGGIEPDEDRPAERWFMSIRPGKTPENSAKVRRTVAWIEEWQAAHAAQAGVTP